MNTNTTECHVWKYSPQAGSEILPLILDPIPSNLDDACSLLPAGVYTTIRTFDGIKVLRLNDHFQRLEKSAALAGVPVQVSRQIIIKMILAALEFFKPDDIRFRLVLDLSTVTGDIYLAATRFEPPPEQLYSKGVAVVTARTERNNPESKVTDYIRTGSDLRTSTDRYAYEVLLISNSGEILEGTTSNFFAVMAGKIYSASKGILAGITRTLVLDEAYKAGIPVVEKGISIPELPGIEEAFITSSTRGIIPVVAINHRAVASGEPGSITRWLMVRYADRIHQELESLSPSRDASSSPALGPSISSPRS